MCSLGRKDDWHLHPGHYSHSSDIRQISWASCAALNEEATGQVGLDSKEVGKENYWMFLEEGGCRSQTRMYCEQVRKKERDWPLIILKSKFLVISSENELLLSRVAPGLLPGVSVDPGDPP